MSDAPTAVTLNLAMSRILRKGKEIQGETSNPLMMNFIIWNARGENSVIFLIHCEALVQTHRPALLILLETKMAKHKNIYNALKFDGYIQTPAEGLSNDIVVI